MTILSSQSEQSVYPIVAVRDAIVFTGTENVLVFGRTKSLTGIEEGIKRGNRVVLVMQKSSSIDDPKKEDLYNTAVLAIIEKTVPGEKGEMNVLVKGQEKVKIIQYTKEIPYLEARVSKLEDKVTTDEEAQAMAKYLVSQVKRAINLGKTVDLVFLMNILNIKDPQDFSYQIAVVLDIKTEERQKLLEETDLKLRLRQEVDYINREIKILEIEKNISSKTQQKFEQGMRESFLREKMKTIEEELGGKGEDRDIMEYREKIRKAKMPKNVEEKTLKELKRLSQMSQFNPEASYIRTYLDWLVELPWSVESANNVDIKLAEKILNEDHYGLKKIKERILEYLAVMELSKRKEVKQQSQKKEHQPTILCFVGPPGVGKTSLGRSIARALARKFVKISLGGIRDEAEIRGHRRTYVGALPGRIIQGIKQAGSKNPVFMLDEIDKVGRDYRGDPSAALL